MESLSGAAGERMPAVLLGGHLWVVSGVGEPGEGPV